MSNYISPVEEMQHLVGEDTSLSGPLVNKRGRMQHYGMLSIGKGDWSLATNEWLCICL